MYVFCLELLSSRPALDHDSGILADVATLCFLVRFSLFFEPWRTLRQPLPSLAQLAFPPKRLQRFLRGCAVATARKLVTAPATMCIGAWTPMIWRNRIFARVMSGFVVREGVRLQAAAAARIAGKRCVFDAAGSGNVADVLSYLIADTNCVNERVDDESW